MPTEMTDKSYNDQVLFVVGQTAQRFDNVIKLFEKILPSTHDIYLARLKMISAKINQGMGSETYFVCTGEFSAGKSTFLNAILGEDILPTASRPCTSIVTEIKLVSDNVGHSASVYFVDGKVKDMDLSEFKELADGATGQVGRLAAIHHVRLHYDISSSMEYDEEFSLLKKLEEINIVLVDTPGFGSPYPFNEDVVFSYLGKASFGFWFFPADRIGGLACKGIMQKVRSKGKKIQVVPIVTKSDLVDDEDRIHIVDQFYDQYGNIFAEESLHFISAYKLNEAIALRKQSAKKTDKERDVLVGRAIDLEAQSGVEHIAMKITEKTTSHGFRKIKVADLINDSQDFCKMSVDLASKLKNSYIAALGGLGWSPTDNYKFANITRSKLERWAKDESKRLAEKYEANLGDIIIPLINSKKGMSALENDVLAAIKSVNEKFVSIQFGSTSSYILSEFHLDIDTKINPSVGVEELRFFSIKDFMIDKMAVAFKSLSEIGVEATIKLTGGGILIALSTAVSSLWGVGAVLAPVLLASGGALCGLALVALVPAIIKNNRNQKDMAEAKIKNEIKKWIEQTKFDKIFLSSLLEAIEYAYKECVLLSDSKTGDILINLKSAESILDECKYIQSMHKDTLLQISKLNI